MRSLIILAVMLSKSYATSAQASLIYVGDPMCSWCYGISEELSMVWDSYPDLDKDVILGGLRPGGGDVWDAEFRDFLKHHWLDVQAASGVPFSFDLLDRTSFDYDTEPACRAVAIVKQIAPTRAFQFFKSVQRGFYLEGRDPKEVDFYKSICADLEIDFTDFERRFDTNEARDAVAAEFTTARSLGANSFPTVLLRMEGQIHVIAKGYATAEQMADQINKHLK